MKDFPDFMKNPEKPELNKVLNLQKTLKDLFLMA